MRIVIIADVHANAASLEVLPDADLVICAGDLVTYGPAPQLVIDLMRQRGVRCVRGDEDNAVAHGVLHVAPPHLERAAFETRAWTGAILSGEQRRWLGGLAPELEFDTPVGRVAVTHAYPGDYERYLEPNQEELERVARAYPRASTVILGHTHRQGSWRVGQTTIVMPGSLGQSGSGGHAHYATIEGTRLTLHEVPYDVGRTAEAINATPWTHATKDECIEALRRGANRPHQRLASVARASAAH